MKPFLKGIIIGLFLKNPVEVFLKKTIIGGLTLFFKFKNNKKNKKIINNNDLNNNNNKINKINLLCKITNESLFNEIFPNKKLPIFWNYSNKKNVIKIELPIELLNKLNNEEYPEITDYSFNKLLDTTSIINNNISDFIVTVDHKLLKKFSDIYLYFHYSLDNKSYINIYSEKNTIKLTDFKIPNNNDYFNKIVCCTLKQNNKEKTHYVTKHVKKFINNNINTKITPELIFMDYPELNINIIKSILYIIHDKYINEYSYNDLLFNE